MRRGKCTLAKVELQAPAAGAPDLMGGPLTSPRAHRATAPRRITAIVICAFLAASIGAGLIYYETPARVGSELQTHVPFRTTIVAKAIANGFIQPAKLVAVKSSATGVVEQVMVKPGQDVVSGQTIARVRIVPDPSLVNAARSEVMRAEMALEKAADELDRQTALMKQELIPKADYREYEYRYGLAQEMYNAAKRDLEIAMSGEATGVGEEANLGRATAGGTVLSVDVEPGSWVIRGNYFNDGTTLCTVADMSSLAFTGLADESDAGRIRVGMPATVRLGALPDRGFAGTVASVAPRGTSTPSGVRFEVTVSLQASRDMPKSAGYSATAEIDVDKRTNVLAILEKDVLLDGDRPYVMRETMPGVFERVSVSLGLSDGINVELLSGLGDEDRLKAQGLLRERSQ